MDVDTFMVPVSCWMDETAARVAATPLRPRGPAPTLSDREVLTMLLVGAYE